MRPKRPGPAAGRQNGGNRSDLYHEGGYCARTPGACGRSNLPKSGWRAGFFHPGHTGVENLDRIEISRPVLQGGVIGIAAQGDHSQVAPAQIDGMLQTLPQQQGIELAFDDAGRFGRGEQRIGQVQSPVARRAPGCTWVCQPAAGFSGSTGFRLSWDGIKMPWAIAIRPPSRPQLAGLSFQFLGMYPILGSL